MNLKDLSATVGIIGGSGLYNLSELNEPARLIVRTPYGLPSAPVLFGRLKNVAVAFVARHGQGHSVAPHEVNYRANLAALAQRGVTTVVAVAAVGAIKSSISDGDIVICDQIIDYTHGREATFVEAGVEAGNPVVHVDFTDPFTPSVRQVLIQAAQDLSINVHPSGTYAATQGPRFESPAEIDRYERDGAHVVGMTGMPEAVLARELGLRYANIALSVNPAAGRGSDTEIDFGLIRKTLDDGMVVVHRLLAHALPRLAELSA